MANTIAQIQASDGLTLTLKLYADDSDTIANGASGDTLTERTNDKGTYRATVTEALAGVYRYRATDANDVTMARGMIDMVDDTATHEGYDPAPSDMALESTSQAIVADTNELQTDWADGGRLDLLLDAIPTTPMRGTDSAALAATALSTAVWTGVPTGFLAATFPTTLASTTNITGGTITTVGTCTTNSDMRGTDGANTVVPDAAGTIPTGMALETTSQTILADTNELQLNQGNWITATGFSTHTAADVWTVGARTVTGGTITTLSGHTPQTGDSFARIGATGSGLTSLATQTSVNTTNDRLGFTLAALAGNCADPQTAAETYSIILGANTFTIDHTGLDATGTRTTATLTKS